MKILKPTGNRLEKTADKKVLSILYLKPFRS